MKDKKKSNSFFAIGISLFVFLRMVISIPASDWGLDLDALQVILDFKKQGLFCLILLLSVVAGLVISKISKLDGVLPKWICAWLALDSVFLLLQDNHMKLIVSALGLLCALNAIQKKHPIKIEFTLLAFVFVAGLVLPASIFSYIPFAIGIYCFAGTMTHSLEKSQKIAALLMIVLSIAGVAISIFAFNENATPVQQDVMQPDVIVENKIKFATLFLPNIVVLLVYVRSLLQKNKGVTFAYRLKDGIGKMLCFVGVVYLLGIIGFFVGGYESVCVINLAVPIAILIREGNKKTQGDSASQIEASLGKWLFPIMALVVLWSWFSFNVLSVCNENLNGQAIQDVLVNSFNS